MPGPYRVREEEATTTTRATRVAPSHVARHDPRALAARHDPRALAAHASGRLAAPPRPDPPLASLYPTSAREPADLDAARFLGATLRLFDVEVLVVEVAPRVIGDRGEAPALVAAFHARFERTIVLVARDRRGVPTFFGPGPIATVLARIPFEALPWQRYRYRPPRPVLLPIPLEPPGFDSAGDRYETVDASVVAETRDARVAARTLDLRGRDAGIGLRGAPSAAVSDRSAPARTVAGRAGRRG